MKNHKLVDLGERYMNHMLETGEVRPRIEGERETACDRERERERERSGIKT